MAEVTHRRILAIAGPIVLSNATIPLLGAVDTAVVGQMGQAAPIGAVGMGAIILASVYWIFGFLRMGTTGLVAQARGAGDAAEEGAVLIRGLGIAAVAGLALVALQGPLAAAAFGIAPGTAEVEALARDYIAIRIWGAPATIALYALTGWLIALERTRAVLALQLVMNGTNAALDLLFVLGFGWGVEGVAVATLIAEWGGVALGLWLARGAFGGGLSRARLLAAGPLARMLAVNRDIMLRSVMLQGCFTAFLFLGAGQGDQTLAANQLLMQFVEITAYALDGFAFAAEALVGQAVGARSRPMLIRAARMASLWGVAGAGALSAAYAAGGGAVIDLMTTAPGVRAEARAYLPWAAAGPMLGIASWMLDGIFIGATRAREMRDAMALSAVAFALSLMVLMPAFGNHGLWAAFAILSLVRALTLWRALPAVLRAASEPAVAAGADGVGDARESVARQ